MDYPLDPQSNKFLRRDTNPSPQFPVFLPCKDQHSASVVMGSRAARHLGIFLNWAGMTSHWPLINPAAPPAEQLRFHAVSPPIGDADPQVCVSAYQLLSGGAQKR